MLDAGGAKHFDKHGANPLGYALVLFACRRFGDAIAYLWQQGKAVPAVHFTVLCLYYGLVLPHKPLCHNPTRRTDAELNQDLTPHSVLHSFLVNHFNDTQPERCVGYLRLLYLFDGSADFLRATIDPEALQKEAALSAIYADEAIIDFLSSTSQQQLQGLVAPVTRLLGQSKCSTLLAQTAGEMLQARREEDAVYVYELAQMYGEFFTVICSQMQAYIRAEAFSDPKWDSWRRVAVTVHDKYIGSADDRVRKTIPQELLQTFVTLVQLSLFFSQCNAMHCKEALDTIVAMGVVPSHSGDTAGARAAFASSSPTIKGIFDVVLRYAMRCLRLVFQNVRNLSTPLPGLYTDPVSYMEHLKHRARGLHSLCIELHKELNKFEDTEETLRLDESAMTF